jgi:predicted RNA binding protein YcfA (HicA-like mRNA interferase family)
MAIDDLDTLRISLPKLFQDWPIPAGWASTFGSVRIDHPESRTSSEAESTLLSDTSLVYTDTGEEALTPASSIASELLRISLETYFPGAPLRIEDFNIPRTPDTLATYLPFHYFPPELWGIYLFADGVRWLQNRFVDYGGGILSQDEARRVARIFLFGHEAFHHAAECFATRLEIVHRKPLYRTVLEQLYREGLRTGDSAEESLASAHGYNRVKLTAFPRQAKKKKSAALDAIKAYLSTLQPAYRGALDVIDEGFGTVRNRFAETSHLRSFGGDQLDPDLWSAFPQAFAPIGRVTSRVNYLVVRSGGMWQRLPLHLRNLTYREIAQELREAGCEILRQGKGSHEIWKARNGTRRPVPRHSGDLSPGTAARILKWARTQA